VSEFDFRLLLETLSDAIVACDTSGRIVYANGAVQGLLGWPPPELLGRPLDVIIPVRLHDAHKEGFARYLESHELRTAGRPMRLSALRRDGTEVEVELTLSQLRDSSGQEVMIGSLRDLRERVELERLMTLTRYLQATARAGSRLGGRLELSQVLETAVRTLVDDFDAVLARIWLVAPGPKRALALVASAGLTERVVGDPQERLDLEDNDSEVGEAARSLRPVVRDVAGLDAQAAGSWVARVPAAAVAAFPLTAGKELLGVIAYVAPRRLDGEVVDALATFGAIVSAALHDVAIVRREQEARIDAEDQKGKLETILETIPVGVLLAEGPEGRLTLANPAAHQVLGSDALPPTTEAFFSAFPLNHLDGRPVTEDERPLTRSLLRGERTRAMYRQHLPDGREAVFDLSTAPFPGPAGGAVSTFADMTERFRLEAELADRAAQFKALLDHLPVGVAYFDRMGVCRASNGPARRILGRSRREITGATADELFARSPALHDALIRCVNDKTPHAQDGVPWVDDTTRYLDWRFEPLPAPEPGKTRGALALIVDVTERALAEFALQRAAEAAESASRRKTQFLSAVSHDLRTPVNALSLQAELLARLIELRGDSDIELTQLATDIRTVAANLIDLINDLLDLTRFDSGAVDYHPTDFPLEEFFQQTLDPLEATAATKGLDFSWRVDRPGRVIRGDRVKLGRVLVNLVSNAVKFTERGSVSVSARAAHDGGLIVTVGDTGPGIPTDQLDRIFDEFAQLRNPERDRTKGTGLGLAICRRLVEGVGGRLTVESVVGSGSTFTARYPPDHMAADVSYRPAEPEVEPGPGGPVPTEPILLVEDDANSRDTLARLLRHAGYSVETAPDGLAALALLGRIRPALVLLDLMMPGMEGGEVLRVIRSTPEWQDLKVILLTGDVLTGRTGDLMALNVDGLLAKPVDFNHLLSMVARFAPSSTRGRGHSPDMVQT
jgi:PAS domain S-box-containing protein